MSETKMPSFVGRGKLSTVPPTPDKASMRADQFLRDFIATGETLEQQRLEIERQQIEIEKLNARNGYTSTELKRIARGRDQFQRQYCELKVALEVIVTTAVTSCDQAKEANRVCKEACIMAADNACRLTDQACQNLIDQARATLASVKAELIRHGIEPPEDAEPSAQLTEMEEATVTGLAARLSPREHVGP